MITPHHPRPPDQRDNQQYRPPLPTVPKDNQSRRQRIACRVSRNFRRKHRNEKNPAVHTKKKRNKRNNATGANNLRKTRSQTIMVKRITSGTILRRRSRISQSRPTRCNACSRIMVGGPIKIKSHRSAINHDTPLRNKASSNTTAIPTMGSKILERIVANFFMHSPCTPHSRSESDTTLPDFILT